MVSSNMSVNCFQFLQGLQIHLIENFVHCKAICVQVLMLILEAKFGSTQRAFNGFVLLHKA